jgi:VWFA-related protein
MRMRVPSFAWILLAAIFAVPAGFARAQQPAGPIHPAPGANDKKPGVDLTPPPLQEKPLVIRTTEVITPVTVQDRDGELILDLEQKDFHVFDNGTEQSILHFDLGGDPLAVVFLAESSSRIESLLPAVRHSATIFTQTVMAQTGEAAVVTYDDSIDVRRDFTGDADLVESAIHGLPMGSSGARLYDAISESVRLLAKQPERERRILLIVGEAQDTGSETKLGQALREATLANVTIYTIGLSTLGAEFRNPPKPYAPTEIGPPGTFPLPTPPGVPQTPQTESQTYGNIDMLSLAIWVVKHASNAVKNHALEVATEATGGVHYATMKDRTIEKAMDEIGAELHAQYTLGYKPPGDESSGFHEIKVTVTRPGVRVRTRPGYYLPPGPTK